MKMSDEWYEEKSRLLNNQKWSCAICESEIESTKDCALDHCHKSNKIRGVLCRNCNLAIGLFKDNERSLLKAVEYLVPGYLESIGIKNPRKRIMCSVKGCDRETEVEAILYDFYPYSEAFFETDVTCPYMCIEHATMNEASASGVREPRGHVRYELSNKCNANGFTIYKPV